MQWLRHEQSRRENGFKQFIYKWRVCPGSYNLKVEMNVGKRAWKEVKKQVRKENEDGGGEGGRKEAGGEGDEDGCGEGGGGRRGRKWGKR